MNRQLAESRKAIATAMGEGGDNSAVTQRTARVDPHSTMAAVNKRVSHPFYVSYMAAFIGMVTAFPTPVTETLCVLNVALFVYMAFDDEHVLARSKLAADYSEYKAIARKFLPRLTTPK